MHFDKSEQPNKIEQATISLVQFDSKTTQLFIYFGHDAATITDALDKNNIEYILDAKEKAVVIKNHFIPVAFLFKKYLAQKDFETILKSDPSKEQWGRYLNQLLKIPGCFNDLLKRCKNTTTTTTQSHPTFFNNTPPKLPSATVSVDAPECYLRFATIMSNCLYGGDLVEKGYYSHGVVQFKKDIRDAGHFITFPSSIHCRAMVFLLALRFFANWRSKNCPAQFVIYEGGAGNGNLAHEFLLLIQKLATEHKIPGWSEFLAALKYRIVEISPALIKVQSQLNQVFIDNGKLQIIEADATCYSFAEEHIDEFVGNELVDAFECEELEILPDQSLNAVVRIPYVLKKDCDQTLFSKLEKQSQEYQAQFNKFFTKSYLDLDKVLILDHKTLMLHKELHDKVQFSEAHVDIKYIPALRPYLRYEGMLRAMLARPNRKLFVNLGVLNFITNLRGRASEILLLDYGRGENELAESNTVHLIPTTSLATLFQKGGFTKWGQFDMTTNVDFTNLYNLLAKNYKFFQYGQQSLILGAINGELFSQVLGCLAVSKDPYFSELVISLQKLFEVDSYHIDRLEEHEHPSNYALVYQLTRIDVTRTFKGLVCNDSGREHEIYNVGPLLPNDPKFFEQMHALAMGFAAEYPECVAKASTLS